MKVWVVFRCIGSGSIAGVFSSLQFASNYVEAHSYTAHIITEHVIDVAYASP